SRALLARRPPLRASVRGRNGEEYRRPTRAARGRPPRNSTASSGYAASVLAFVLRQADHSGTEVRLVQASLPAAAAGLYPEGRPSDRCPVAWRRGSPAQTHSPASGLTPTVLPFQRPPPLPAIPVGVPYPRR